MLMMRKFMPGAGSVNGLAVLWLAMALAVEGLASAHNPAPAQPEPISPLQVRYQLDIPGGGEIFPALTSCGPPHYWPVATL